VVVSLTSGVPPVSSESVICTAAFANSRVSLNTVWVCSPAMIDFTDASSASCPVTMGSGLAGVPYPALFRAEMMPRDMPS